MNKKILAGLAAGTIVLGGLGTSQVLAQGTDSNYPPVIENLAKRFGATEKAVHEVFQDTRREQFALKLSEAIENGDISEDQKVLILEKQEEMNEKMEEIRNSDMSDDEKDEAMKQLHEEHRSWAEENEISFLKLGRGMRRKGGGFGGEMRMHKGEMGGRQ